GVARPADAARALVDLGYGHAEVEELTSAIPPDNVPGFLSWMARADEAQRLLAEVGKGAGRISQIVGAMRFHHQASRPGDRAWPEHQPQHRGPGTPRADRSRLQTRPSYIPGIPLHRRLGLTPPSGFAEVAVDEHHRHRALA